MGPATFGAPRCGSWRSESWPGPRAGGDPVVRPAAEVREPMLMALEERKAEVHVTLRRAATAGHHVPATGHSGEAEERDDDKEEAHERGRRVAEDVRRRKHATEDGRVLEGTLWTHR